MSNPKCPLCKAKNLADVGLCTADDAACYGIVLRDVVPMQDLAYKLCTEHARKIAKYYELMDALALEEILKKELDEDVNAENIDWESEPPLLSSKTKKDLN